MEDIAKEVFISNSPSSINAKRTKEILFQMENCICKIIKNNGENGTGFFCKIKLNKNKELLHVLVTNNHVLNSEDLKLINQYQLFLMKIKK